VTLPLEGCNLPRFQHCSCFADTEGVKAYAVRGLWLSACVALVAALVLIEINNPCDPDGTAVTDAALATTVLSGVLVAAALFITLTRPHAAALRTTIASSAGLLVGIILWSYYFLTWIGKCAN
jgi:hypothetical protein